MAAKLANMATLSPSRMAFAGDYSLNDTWDYTSTANYEITVVSELDGKWCRSNWRLLCSRNRTDLTPEQTEGEVSDSVRIPRHNGGRDFIVSTFRGGND